MDWAAVGENPSATLVQLLRRGVCPDVLLGYARCSHLTNLRAGMLFRRLSVHTQGGDRRQVLRGSKAGRSSRNTGHIVEHRRGGDIPMSTALDDDPKLGRAGDVNRVVGLRRTTPVGTTAIPASSSWPDVPK
jgi:hypothetical protein